MKLSAYPGEEIEVTFQTFDELDKSVGGIFRLTDVSFTTATGSNLIKYNLCTKESYVFFFRP